MIDSRCRTKVHLDQSGRDVRLVFGLPAAGLIRPDVAQDKHAALHSTGPYTMEPNPDSLIHHRVATDPKRLEEPAGHR
jgi:hypothetical protein